jgi:hypothetical protein
MTEPYYTDLLKQIAAVGESVSRLSERVRRMEKREAAIEATIRQSDLTVNATIRRKFKPAAISPSN